MKLLQKTALVAATAVVTISGSITGAVADKKNYRTGVYAGAEMGWLYEEHKYRERSTIVPNPNLTPSTNKSSHKHSNSFLPGIFIGYRQFMNCYFVGLEIAAKINSSSTHAKFSQVVADGVDAGTELDTLISSHHLRGRYNIMPALTFGKTFNERLAAYGKIGYDYGQYKYRITESVVGLGVGNSKKSHKDFNRFFLGIGAEYAVSCLWSARLEYNYTFNCSSKKVKMSADAVGSGGRNDYLTRLKVSSSALKVGMFAKF